MTCSNCNHVLNADAKFCNKCGATQEAAPPPVNTVTHSYQQLGDKHKKHLPYILAGAGVLILVVVILLLTMGGNGRDSGLVGRWEGGYGETFVLMRNGTGHVIEEDWRGNEIVEDFTWHTQRHKGMRVLVLNFDLSSNAFPHDFQTFNFEYERISHRGDVQIRLRPLGDSFWEELTRVGN
jgi:hypothetical protein